MFKLECDSMLAGEEGAEELATAEEPDVFAGLVMKLRDRLPGCGGEDGRIGEGCRLRRSGRGAW